MIYEPGQRVVPMDFAYGYYANCKCFAGTVLRYTGEEDDQYEVAWDDGETDYEASGDITHIGATTDDVMFGDFSSLVRKP